MAGRILCERLIIASARLQFAEICPGSEEVDGRTDSSLLLRIVFLSGSQFVVLYLIGALFKRLETPSLVNGGGVIIAFDLFVV